MTQEDILYIHHRLIEDYGGVHGVRDLHRLESAFHKLQTHTNPITAASFFIRDVIQHHPFVDGNKRTAVTIMALHLHKNSIKLVCSPKELEDFAILVATKKYTIVEIEQWLLTNTIPN